MTMAIRLLVGLGNPGAQYEATRHNAGFWLAEQFVRGEGARFRSESGFFGRVAQTGQVRVLLPQTYMNRSGQAVGALARFYKIAPEEILVAHDELDLLPGAAKIKKGGGHAGHNGLKDITASLGSSEFWRLRIGIGHPRALNLEQEVVDFVLHAPRREERELIDGVIERSIGVLPDLFAGSIDAAIMKLHTKE
jgi:peptidyl-tRNA hydrolase, PTH1 family